MRFSDLVVPLDRQHRSTVTRATDTSGQQDLFGRSGAVSRTIGATPGLRPGDVDSMNGPSTATTPTTRGCRTSATATRTSTTSRIRAPWSSSAEQNAAPEGHAFSFEDFDAYYLSCRRRKRNKRSARAFELALESNLWDLLTELNDGRYAPGPSTCFVITRPRPREVWAAEFRDRIVHHMLYNAIGAGIERSFIADSCACIPGRGTLYAVHRLEDKVRSITQNWSRPAFYLKMDIANFFVSIDKGILADQLRAKIREPRWRDQALQILLHDPRPGARILTHPGTMDRVPHHKRLAEAPAGRGLPIGNLSSQFFANVHLDALDQFVKHQLRCRHYIRYVDDMIMLHESPQQLNAWRNAVDQFLRDRLRLQINPGKTILQPVDRGIDFVGQVIKPWRTTLRRRTYNSALHRLRKTDDAELFVTANSYLGLLRQASHSRTDRVRIGNVLRKRGRCIDAGLTKTYRKSGP